jgi:hypothetical protein
MQGFAPRHRRFRGDGCRDRVQQPTSTRTMDRELAVEDAKSHAPAIDRGGEGDTQPGGKRGKRGSGAHNSTTYAKTSSGSRFSPAERSSPVGSAGDDIGLPRYTPDGQLDPTFGTSVVLTVANPGQANDVAVTPSGPARSSRSTLRGGSSAPATPLTAPTPNSPSCAPTPERSYYSMFATFKGSAWRELGTWHLGVKGAMMDSNLVG